MSENLQKFIGIAVMAVIVVLGVVATNNDDSDFTRNRAMRRVVENTNALGSANESGEARNQSDAESLRSESAETVETATRLEGGNELATADCCDQNAYEILKLQNQYADIEKQLGKISKTLSKTEDSLVDAEEIIEKLQDGSCSSLALEVGDGTQGLQASQCAYIAHAEMVVPMGNVGAVWVKKSSGSNTCKVGEGLVNYGLGAASGSVGLDLGSVDLCSSTWTDIPNIIGPSKSKFVQDKYLRFALSCPSVANFVPRDHELYVPWEDPKINMIKLKNLSAEYWIAPQAGSAYFSKVNDLSGTWQLGLDVSDPDAKKLWKGGTQQELVGWTFDAEAMDIYGKSEADSFATRGITIIINDLDTGERHYAYVTASVGYRIFDGDLKDLKEGTAKGRCDGDLTMVRSYS